MKPHIALSLSYCCSSKKGQTGFSLVELMVGMTLGLIVIASVSQLFLNNSRARAEMDKTSQQIENGRYAAQLLMEDLRLAGYYGELNPANVTTPSSKPDPCATDSASLIAAVALPVQGYDGGSGLPSTCDTVLTDRKQSTDVLVIRRASTCVAGTTGCEAMDTSKYTYYQVALCSTNVDQYVVTTDSNSLGMTKRDCSTTADIRSYFTRIYYVANNNKSGDGIPTLKMVELGAGAFGSPVPLVAGIEQLQIEYGIDTNSSTQHGAPTAYTADPDSYGSCKDANCQKNWRSVTAVKLYILARNTEASSGYADSHSYILGKDATGGDNVIAADGSAYKRHVYTTVVRLMNVAGRLE